MPRRTAAGCRALLEEFGAADALERSIADAVEQQAWSPSSFGADDLDEVLALFERHRSLTGNVSASADQIDVADTQLLWLEFTADGACLVTVEVDGSRARALEVLDLVRTNASARAGIAYLGDAVEHDGIASFERYVRRAIAGGDSGFIA